MGWLWSTSTPSSSSTPSSDHNDSNTPQSFPESTPLEPPSKPLSRDEIADQELHSFLQELDADTHVSSTKYNRVPRAPSTSSHTSPTSSSPIAEELLPKTMSCRTAFDEAFYCNSFGGRFNDLYRYGNLRSCSESWNDFWFCMRTRGYGGVQKELAIKDHYRKKETAKYAKDLGNESSENVWKSRTKMVEWGEAFNQPFPDEKAVEEEWRRREREGRDRKVDGSMG